METESDDIRQSIIIYREVEYRVTYKIVMVPSPNHRGYNERKKVIKIEQNIRAIPVRLHPSGRIYREIGANLDQLLDLYPRSK
jgi:hypothetical protein